MTTRKEHQTRRQIYTKLQKRMVRELYSESMWAADEADKLESLTHADNRRPDKEKVAKIAGILARAARSARKLLKILPVLLLLVGCASPKKQPTFRPLILPRLSVIIPPEAPSPAYVPPPVSGFIPWQYADGSNSYCWTLQTSTDLTTWVDVPSTCLTGETFVSATNALRFYRLKGTKF